MSKRIWRHAMLLSTRTGALRIGLTIASLVVAAVVAGAAHTSNPDWS